MTQKQIDYINGFAKHCIYCNVYDRQITLSSREDSLKLIFEIDILPKDGVEDWYFDLEEIDVATNIEFLELARIEKIVICDGDDSFEIEDDFFTNRFKDTTGALKYLSDSSAAGKLFAALGLFYQNYKNIPPYVLTDPEDSGYCPPAKYKLYKIEFPESDFDLATGFFELLCLNYPEQNFTAVYLHFEDWNIFRAKYYRVSEVPILQSNTKARRLGYLKFIIRKFDQSNYFPANYLNRQIEQEALSLVPSLQEYKVKYGGDDKGLISLSKTGISAAPYTDMLLKLNLITEISRSFILTKQAKVYSVLGRKLTEQKLDSDNIFELNLLDKTFLLRTLFVTDGLYSVSILELLRIAFSGISVPDMKAIFQGHVISEMDRVIGEHMISTDFKRTANEIKKRIQNWTKPQKYLGHIIEPRLNWMLDLKLVECIGQRKVIYRLTESGKRLIEIIESLYEETGLKGISIEYIFNQYYLQILEYVYELRGLHKRFDEGLVNTYIDEAFRIFKTEAPNRIAASQAIEYVSVRSFLENGLIMENSEVKDYLARKNLHNFSLDWFGSEGDGALYRKN